jgi:TPR repeat protein
MLIHIKRNAEVFGPYSIEEAREYLSAGRLSLSDFAQLPGNTEWIPLASVPGVKSAPPPPPPSSSAELPGTAPGSTHQTSSSAASPGANKHATGSAAPGRRQSSLKKFIKTAAIIAVLIPLWSWWQFGDCRYLLWSDNQRTIFNADKGHAWAQTDLGYMFNVGQGVPQNYEEAFKWYSKAAKQGNATAQNNLGIMFQNGQAVQRDLVEAYKWYCLSAAQGNTNAINNRDILLSSLTPQQIAEGQSEAANPVPNSESVAAVKFERDFFEKYPDLKAHRAVVDAVAQKLEASGYKGESREAVMEEYAKEAREELARQRGSSP